MIQNDDLMTLLGEHRGDALVVSTMTATGSWGRVSSQASRDIPLGGAMGKASSFALGLALAQPDPKVIILDGDGSLEMNLGSLATIAGKQPANLYHFVLENGVYAITGGQPIPAKDRVDFSEMAGGAGYAASYTFDNLEDLTLQIGEVLGQDGPVFVTIKSVPEVQNEPIGRRTRPANRRTTSVAIAAMSDEIGLDR